MKTGDKVIVPAEINGYGRDLQAMVTDNERATENSVYCPYHKPYYLK